MVEEYQTRLDIDRLYDLVWDAESNQLKLTQVQDFLALMQKLGFNQDNHVAINFAVITQSNGDIEYWIMDNAYYDYDVNRFIKLDTEKSSQAIQLTNSSLNLWSNPSREDVILDYDHYYYDDYLFKNYIGAKSKDDGEWVVFDISSGWTDNGGGGGSVTPSDTTPLSDSTNGSAGTDNKYSRADHSHPLLSSYPPSTHNHDDRYYDKTTSDGRYSQIGHDHDSRYYEKTISDKKYSSTTHAHDDKYLPLTFDFGWHEVEEFDGNAHLYVNHVSRMAELRWTYTNTTSRSAGDEITYQVSGTTEYIPTDYRPPYVRSNIGINGDTVLRVGINGNITLKFLKAFGSSEVVFYMSLLWRY